MSCRWIIYGLFDPIDGSLRYIGKSSSGLKRPARHTSPCELKNSTHKNRWIKSLISRQLRPIIRTLYVCISANELSKKEIEFIAHYRKMGAKLTNLTSGGDGCPGRVHKQSTKDKISKGVKNSRRDIDTLIRISIGKGCRPFQDIRSGKIYRTIVEAAKRIKTSTQWN